MGVKDARRPVVGQFASTKQRASTRRICLQGARLKTNMPKRSSKPPEDENRAAFDTVARLTGQTEAEPEKNPAAQALGRLGGLKGGKARAASMSPEQRQEVAKKAAEARWGKKKTES